jgi:nicotinate phosphoribosyltransferase
MVVSILDNDLYKFTTSYAYMNKYPDASGTFEFVDRKNTTITQTMVQKINEAIDNLCNLTFADNEFEYCVNNIKYVPRYYWEWLKGFKFEKSKIEIEVDDNKHLHIHVTDKLYKATLYEVPLLAIVSEVVMSERFPNITLDWNKIKTNFENKLQIAKANDFTFSEFGTRRRYSNEIQDYILSLVNYNKTTGKNIQCIGTSNVYFAMKYELTPMGTHPHEWFMFHGAQFGYKHANYLALEAWADIYQGDLGTALTDTFTSEAFFRNFSMKHAKLYDSIRHDSGDPYKFTDKAVARYKEHKINPLLKTIVYSDGLDFDGAALIKRYSINKIKAGFGIGTNITNDIEGTEPCNIVMKLISCRMNDNQPTYGCIKLSDVEGKHIGNEKDIEVAKYELNIGD